MGNVVRTKDAAVTIGVIDRNLAVAENLREVTYRDVFGTLHTVYAHRDGPFGTPEDVVTAHEQGVLHPFAEHDTAIAYSRERGDHTTADAVESYASANQARTRQNGDDE